MPKTRVAATKVAAEIRQMLRTGGTREHADGVQWFFKDEIKSHGWYTAPLRKAAVQARKRILLEWDLKFLLDVADQLFSGQVLEEKVFGVFLLEKLTDKFGDAEFRRFESWLGRISSWADHDGLVHYLIGPMIATKHSRATHIYRWAKSPNRWHRRAACVGLIHATRQKMSFRDVQRLSNMLLSDQDDMVQKGLGWLLRETGKFNPQRAVPYLNRIRASAPRLVLRTACETLPKAVQKQILARTRS